MIHGGAWVRAWIIGMLIMYDNIGYGNKDSNGMIMFEA